MERALVGEDPGQTQDRVTIQEAVRGASLERARSSPFFYEWPWRCCGPPRVREGMRLAL
jgi:hypothetical protein